MFGAEGQGLGSAALALAHRRLNIPVDTRVESLNVAAAAAVCLFEQRRRRLARS
jgi:TrmH family RNA methyltransferase